MAIKFVFAGEKTELQNASINVLEECFEEWRIFTAKYGRKFSFQEISFAALNEEDEVIAHVGLMPFEVSDGNGGVIAMAGVASVATGIAYRKRGIASQLCSNAAAWAKENGFDCLPLYTAFNRVYESCSWQNVPVCGVILENKNVVPCQFKKGSELTAEEREFIIDCYNKMPDFKGKVKRPREWAFHSWERVFRDIFLTWNVTSGGYAVKFEDTLAEFFALDGNAADLCGGAATAFLSPDCPQLEKLLDGGWCRIAENTPPECWHGENVMFRNVSKKNCDGLFFSLTDKF